MFGFVGTPHLLKLADICYAVESREKKSWGGRHWWDRRNRYFSEKKRRLEVSQLIAGRII